MQWLVRLSRIRLLFFGVMTAALCALGENYPFSTFPMYRSFDERVPYVFITDENDQPLATQTVFRQRASDIKKTYETRLRRQKKERAREGLQNVKLSTLPPAARTEAGLETLRWLRSTTPSHRSPLRLNYAELSLAHNRIVSTAEMIAELR